MQVIENYKTNTKFVDEFSREVYEQTYRYGDETINQTHLRVAKDLASVEKDPEHWTEEFLKLLEDFKFVPGGRITSNAGTGLKGTSMINCFTPETNVMTNVGYKPISEIQIGDKVLTHRGRYRDVLSLMKKEYNGNLDIYKSNNLSSDIKSTPEHPFYQGNGDWIISELNKKLVLLKNSNINKKLITIDLFEICKDIKRNGVVSNNVFADSESIYTITEYKTSNGDGQYDTIITKRGKKINRYLKVDEDFAYFIGRFIGDGSTFSVNKKYEVDGFNIAFSKKEIDSVIKLKSIIESVFGEGLEMNINEASGFDGTYLRKNTPIVSHFLMKTCGRYSNNKFIPDYIWQSSNDIRESFLLGLFDSDGMLGKQAKITFNNESLINNLQAMLLEMNIVSTKRREICNEYPDNSYHSLTISKLNSEKFIKKFEKVYSDDRILEYTENKSDTKKGHFPYSTSIEKNEYDGEIFVVNKFDKSQEKYNGYVYNISVDEDESYVVNNAIVHNCFVDGFIGKDQDSMESIMDALKRQAMILKSEGGYGFCADVMRPRGGFIQGIGNESPGSVKMLDMWDTQSSVITEGSGQKGKNKNAKVKIRKGAQMVTMSCWNPAIEEFITAKQTPGRLTKFNMSVLVTDDFMNAVENNLPWNLEFPDFELAHDDYETQWDGNLNLWKSKGLPVRTWKTFNKANELWDVIMKSTYNRAEPGVLFVDTMNKFNNLYYNEYISATNPCGEQILPIGGVCLLGSLNMTQFVDIENGEWDYNKLSTTIPIAVRFMDNVNDKTTVPLEIQKDNLKNKRRIGLGVLGYGSALMMMKVKYGSVRALELTTQLMNFIANTAYKSSALLASEKGSFKLYDRDKFLKSNFLKNLSQDTIEIIGRYGMRNSHLLSIQPTGNGSVFANNVSGGLEPLFMPEYTRTTIFPYPPEGLFRPKNVNWEEKKYDNEGTTWSWIKEGDENLLRTEYAGYVWKFDKSRGLLRETTVRDYAVRTLSAIGQWDPAADWASTTTELSISDHLNTLEVFAKYVDSACSKTINLPNDYPYDDFKKVYVDAYKTGVIKGVTTYRSGTMTTVLSSSDKKDELPSIKKTMAVKRPKTLKCDIHHLTVRNNSWVVIIGLMGADPYEVFAFKKKSISLSPKWKEGKLTKVKSGQYNLEIDDDFVIENLSDHFDSDEEEALTRMISTSLRHGADINFIYDQLSKSQGTVVSFSKAIARSLKTYIDVGQLKENSCPSCGSVNSMVMAEGCFRCTQCSFSKCS